MKLVQKFANEPFARSAAHFLRFACDFVILFYVIFLILTAMGRQSFTLHASTGVYDNAIYSESDFSASSRSMTVHTADDIHVTVNAEGQVDLAVPVALLLMSAVQLVPLIVAYWMLSRVFANIYRGEIFTERNAAFLLNFGLLQLFSTLVAPFLKLLIVHIANLASESHMSIATGSTMLNDLFPSVAFIVAAYIIHYGIHLQDEVDHTL